MPGPVSVMPLEKVPVLVPVSQRFIATGAGDVGDEFGCIGDGAGDGENRRAAGIEDAAAGAAAQVDGVVGGSQAGSDEAERAGCGARTELNGGNQGARGEVDDVVVGG